MVGPRLVEIIRFCAVGCVEVLTTSFWTRTFSEVVVGGVGGRMKREALPMILFGVVVED